MGPDGQAAQDLSRFQQALHLNQLEDPAAAQKFLAPPPYGVLTTPKTQHANTMIENPMF